ncbi:MAG: hypothetical protein PHE53_05315 [Thermoguttaceae bacterium]|nr:hypothetical protein [Thermoguttaceae bacterium]
MSSIRVFDADFLDARSRRVFVQLSTWLGVSVLCVAELFAAQTTSSFNTNSMRSIHPSELAPGMVGGTAAYRGVAGALQRVEIRLPEGTLISSAQAVSTVTAGSTSTDAAGRATPMTENATRWDAPEATALRLGLSVGNVYRFRVGNIPYHPDAELYPTIELFDRLYTPAALQGRFAIPVELTQNDLDLAIAGKLVTRIIYLEDSRTALPVSDAARGEADGAFDLKPDDNPMAIADLFGKPLAILRIGGRRPVHTEAPDLAFTFGAPEYVRYPADENADHLTNVSMWDNVSAENAIGTDAAAQSAQREYLTNGGDRDRGEDGLPIGIEADGKLLGLDSGDAAATYEGSDGQMQKVVVNQAPVYAPRFGGVRQVVGLSEEMSRVGFRDVEQKTRAANVGTREVVWSQKQHEAVRGQVSEQGPSAAEGHDGLNRTETSVGLAMHRDTFRTWENFQRIRIGQMDSAEGLKLAASARAAKAWDQAEGFKVVLGDEVVSSFSRLDGASEVYYVEDGGKRYGRLEVTKVASVADALPGEFVEFTIRYDNIGEAAITKVKLSDSLNPRLEYVEDSAESSFPANFTTRPNADGSLILEWELTEPLMPKDGGIIRFKTQVR